MDDCIKQITIFKAQVFDIMKRIESLIECGYLKRDEKD
jgi:hypothetical protein